MVKIEDAVLVVAHPDDEAIWFSSILDRCKRVIVCFGPSAMSNEPWDSGRLALIDSYPLPKANFLRIRQSSAFQKFKWNRPRTDDGHLIFRRQNLGYAENSQKLMTILQSELYGESLVFTHNPWGEYGHEEHVQVFQALNGIRERLGFNLFVSSYVSNRSLPLMLESLRRFDSTPSPLNHVVFPTDLSIAARLKRLYTEMGCWTWLEDYEWPAIEMFHAVAPPSSPRPSNVTASLPLNFIDHKFSTTLPELIAGRLLPHRVKQLIRRSMRP